MPDSPDFDQIATAILSGPHFRPGSFGQVHIRSIVEQLRLLWNARGAADIVQLDEVLAKMPPFPQGGPFVKQLDRALRMLDR